MIFNHFIGGTVKAICYFQGAVSEKLTIAQNGKTVQTVTTNSSGNTTSAVELKCGVYTITGSVSGYKKTVTIKKDGTYTAYPDGAIYWYGKEIYPITVTKGGKNGTYSTTSYATKNTNSIYLYVKTRGDIGAQYSAMMRTTNTVDTSGYKAINIISTGGSVAYTYSRTVGYKTSSGIDAFNVSTSGGTNTIDSPGSSVYLGATASATTYGPVYSISELTVHAIYLGDKIEEELAGTNTIAVSSTLRYTSENEGLGWSSPGSFGQSENYFGYKTGSWNSAIIPVGKFSFTGSSSRLNISFNGHRPSSDFSMFRWAICTSTANKSAYQKTTSAVSDATQVASGTASLTNYAAAANSYFSFDFNSTKIPANTDLYVYLWAYERSGVAHISGTISASLYSVD